VSDYLIQLLPFRKNKGKIYDHIYERIAALTLTLETEIRNKGEKITDLSKEIILLKGREIQQLELEEGRRNKELFETHKEDIAKKNVEKQLFREEISQHKEELEGLRKAVTTYKSSLSGIYLPITSHPLQCYPILSFIILFYPFISYSILSYPIYIMYTFFALVPLLNFIESFGEEAALSYSLPDDKASLDKILKPYRLDLPRRGHKKLISSFWRLYLNYKNDTVRKPAFMIHGSAGFGKTYLLREVAFKNPEDIPKNLNVEASKIKFIPISYGQPTSIITCETAFVLNSNSEYLMGRFFCASSYNSLRFLAQFCQLSYLHCQIYGDI
jgi:hypothetical protein